MTRVTKIKKIEDNHIEAVSVLHDNSFKDFFLTSLGKSFLEVFYRGILTHENGLAIGAFDGDQLIGFAVGTTNNSGFYRSVLRKNSLKMTWVSFPNLILKPANIKRLVSSLLAFKNNSYTNIPVLLSICVSDQQAAKGVGRKLLEAFEDDLKLQGHKELILTTDAHDNEYVNQFYIRNHYTLVESFFQGKREMNLYHKTI